MITTLLLTAALAFPLEDNVRALAAIAGEPNRIGAAGITRDEMPILTIENGAAFDPAATKRRLVLIGGLDGDARSVDAVVAAVRWFKTRASSATRREWTISALPSAHFDPADTLSLTRWITFQAPDLVVTTGGVWDALKGVPYRSIGVGDGLPPSREASADRRSLGGGGQAVPDGAIAALRKILSTPISRSPLHDELIARVLREPLAIAKVLARRYPEAPSISYIPAIAWTQTLRLAALTNDDSLRERVRQQIQPWMSGEKKLFGDRIQLTSVAGTMIFAELAAAGDTAALRLADEAVPLAAARKPTGIAEYGQGWTDDMFMATSVLARASLRPNHQAELDNAARLLIDYAARVQQPNGLFNHASDAPAAWGRGNGFAAFGLMETLTVMPAQHGSRSKLLEIFRRQMMAAKAQQSPDGMWRQIIDEPGAYREETATAMLMTAMARGIRFGWLDRPYLPAVHRAWRALAAHVAGDGTLVDVCASTGGGTTKRYYFDRPAITGADDRGGAMALLAAMDMYELAKSGQSTRQ
jgi:rhamnogalacturonyl hydrolase YesR